MDLSSIENILARGDNEDPENPLPRCKGCGVVYDLNKRIKEVSDISVPEKDIAGMYCSDECYNLYRDK